MRKHVLTYLFLVFAVNAMAQQEPLHSLNYYNPLLYNPAITGSLNQNQVFILNRAQWKEFNGPQVKAASFDFRVPKQPFSTGIIFSDLKAGAYKVTKAKLNYTHHVRLTEDLKLLLGLSGGISMNRFNTGDITAIRLDDPTLQSSEKSSKPDIDGGALLKGRSFKAGVTLTQLEGDMFSGVESTIVPNRQIVISADYTLPLNDDSTFILAPLLITKLSPGTPLFYDGSLAASWKNIIWLSAGYKSNYAAQVSLGVQIRNIRAAYAYELPVNSLKGFIPPAHELGLGYVFTSYSQSKQKKKPGVKEPKKTTQEKLPKSEKTEDDRLAAKRKELQELQEQLSEREDNLISHERKIYNLIDSLYTKAGQQKTKSNEEELERVARTQREVNKIKEELKQFTREKNVELFQLKQRIDALRREIDAIENKLPKKK